MAYRDPQTVLRTHSVENQPPALKNIDAFTSDVALREARPRGPTLFSSSPRPKRAWVLSCTAVAA